MTPHLRPALTVSIATLLLTGVAYPLVTTGLAQILFPKQANGSPAQDAKGNIVGSELIGQGFARGEYFHPRPSAAGNGWDGTSSGGSNLGPSSKALRDRVTADVAKIKAENPDSPGPVPAELVTTSASGLDPHLSPSAALYQVQRVAAARHAPVERIRALLDARTEGRTFGLLGEPRVNVLLLNLDLDREFPVSSAP